MKMKTETRKTPRTLTVTLGNDLTHWLKAASRQRLISVSAIMREALLPAFEKRATGNKRARA
jgi:post-segregation antitoxin (ccd killing protein)